MKKFFKNQEPDLDEKKKAVTFFTLLELAEMFKVSLRTIYNWKNQGRISFVQIGSKTYVTMTQLQQFLDANAIEQFFYRRA